MLRFNYPSYIYTPLNTSAFLFFLAILFFESAFLTIYPKLTRAFFSIL